MKRFFANAARTAAALAAVTMTVSHARADATDASRARQIVTKASASLDAFKGDPVYPDVTQALRDGVAVVVVPEFIRAGIGIGGEAGTGVMLKKDPRTGTWSAPAFFDLQGASIGPQIGYQKASVLLVIDNNATLEAILRGDVTLGADAGYTAGTTHAQSVASKTGQQERGLQIFTRGEGAFAGATVKGMLIRPNDALNIAYHDANASPDRILANPGAANTGSDGLRAVLTKMAGAKATARQ